MSKEERGLDWLDRALFVSPYCFALCVSKKKYRSELKRLGLPKKNWPEFVLNTHSNATTHIFENAEADLCPCVIVCIRGFENIPRSSVYGLLVHEAVHIWQEAKLNIGELFPSKEFEAYAVQAISQRLIEAFDEEYPVSTKNKRAKPRRRCRSLSRPKLEETSWKH